MIYEVAIYRQSGDRSADIRTPIEAVDPVAAALSVMDRFGLRSASAVFVSCDYHLVAEFYDVQLDSACAPAPDAAVSYDYSW